jgi:hypothetical protein
MMLKVETSTAKEWLAAVCGGDADFSPVSGAPEPPVSGWPVL